MTIARLLTSMALATMLAMPAPAQTIEDAAAAYQRGDLAGALTQYRRLAEQGLAIAQSNLGAMYDNGEGVPEDDAEAVRWYRLAAEQGHACSQHQAGKPGRVEAGRGAGIALRMREDAGWAER